MTNRDQVPGVRAIGSPLTAAMLRPLEPDCWLVHFAQALADDDYRKLSKLLEGRSTVKLRAYGDIRNLEFLKYFPQIKRFQVDEAPELEDLVGLRFLSPDLETLGIGARMSRPLSLRPLERFAALRTLYLEGPVKDIDVIAGLVRLEDLTLRSIAIPSLELLTPMHDLLSLDIKLGGTKNLSHLPSIGKLRYLELWLVRGLAELSPISSVATLQSLKLQALRNVDRLPRMDALAKLRRVYLETMKGIHDPCPLAEAPALEELFFIDMSHMKPDDFKCLVGHPSLKYAAIGLGSRKKNEAVRRILPLPDPPPRLQFR